MSGLGLWSNFMSSYLQVFLEENEQGNWIRSEHWSVCEQTNVSLNGMLIPSEEKNRMCVPVAYL